MGWLFYKSLDEQGEITASSSHLTRPLTLDPRMREMLPAGRGGRGGEGEEVRGGFCVLLSLTRTLPAPQPGGCWSNVA